MSSFAQRTRTRREPEAARREPEVQRHAPGPPPAHDPDLRPTARAAAAVNRHYAEEEEDDGWFGGLSRMADRVTSRARSVVRAVVPPVVRETAASLTEQASRAVEQTRETARAVVSETADTVADVAERAEEATQEVARVADRTRRQVGRSIRESDVGSQVLRVREELAVIEQDLVEQAVDLGEAGVDFVEEDLGVCGEQPDLEAAPEEPTLPIEPADAATARQRAHDLFSATDGLGTDFTAIREALSGMSAAQIQVIEQEYFAYSHQNLRAVLDLETSGSDEDEVEGLLSGDPVLQAVATLRGATTGCDTEDETVRETLRRLTPEQRTAVRGELGDEFFEEQLAGTSEEAALARVANDEIGAQAAELADALQGGLTGSLGRAVGVEGLGADVETANRVMREIPEEGHEAYQTALAERVRERSAHDTIEGEQSLDDMIVDATDDGAERDLSRAILDGDQTGIDAAELALNAEDHWYENPAVITGALMVVCPVAGLAYAAYRLADSAQSGRDPLETADVDQVRAIMERRSGESEDDYRTRVDALRERFADEYGGGDLDALDDMIDEEFTEGSSDHAFLTDLAADGVVDPATQLRYAFEGHLGTNGDLAMDALRGPDGQPLPREAVDAIVGQLDEDGLDVEAEVDGGWLAEMSGDDGFEMRELLRGAPENDAERIAAQLRRDEWARGTGVARGLVDLTGSRAGLLMDEQAAELRRLEGELEDGNLPEGEQAELASALARHGTSETAYRARVDECTEGVATAAGTAAAIAAGVAVEVFSAGAATPLVLALAGAAGGLVDLGVRGAMQGSRLTNEEIGQRVASTGVNALTAGLGVSGVPGALLSAGADEALQIGTGQRQIENLGDVGALGLRMAGAAGSEALGSHLASGIDPGTIGGRVLRGGTSGMVGGLAQPLSNVETYEQGLEGALRTVGTSVVRGVGSGVINEIAQHHTAQRRLRAAAEAEPDIDIDVVVDDDSPPPAHVDAEPDVEVDMSNAQPHAERTPTDVLEELVDTVPGIRNRGSFQGETLGTDVLPEGTQGSVFANEGDANRTQSHAQVGPNGETVVRVATGNGALVIGGNDTRLVSTDFTACGATCIRGTMPDGTPVMLMNHVAAADQVGHQQRLADDLARLRAMGVTDLDVTTVVAEDATRPVPADAHPSDAAYGGFPTELDLGDDVTSRVIQHPGDQSVHVVMTPEGTSIFRGDHIEDSELMSTVPHARPDAAEQFRQELFDPSEPGIRPETRDEALRVRSAQGGLDTAETRAMYQERIDEIPGELEQMADDGASLEEQARRAFDIRHEARVVARGLMDDQVAATGFDRRDLAKYGSLEGPDFEAVTARARAFLEGEAAAAGQDPASVTDDMVYQEVIASTQRTDDETNRAAGVSGRTASRSGRPRETADSLIDEMLEQHRQEVSAHYAD